MPSSFTGFWVTFEPSLAINSATSALALIIGLYHRYGIQKVELCDKLSGIYDQAVVRPDSLLMRGFDDRFLAPHSRYTDVPLKEVLEKSNLQVIAQGNEVGLSIIASPDMREVYSFGHLEYDRDTLAKEYHRDLHSFPTRRSSDLS